MPDDWETQFGFGPELADAAGADNDGDGYQNLEEFLNASDPHRRKR